MSEAEAMPDQPKSAPSAEPVYVTADGVDISNIVRLHRRYHGTAMLVYMASLAAMRSRGIPNKRPSAAERLSTLMSAAEWDSGARRERQAVQPWKGSKEHASILRWGKLDGQRGRGRNQAT